LISIISFQLENINRVLGVLKQNFVPGVENITANDLINGRLKAILSLFFSLSRYKQNLKPKDKMLLRNDR
jgi:hypothetical protein